jgi:hypothetical protein
LYNKATRFNRNISQMGYETTTLYVGTQGEAITIHTNLLRAAGKIFQEVLELQTKTNERINLSKVEPGPFKLLVEYLYTKKVPTATDHSGKAERAKALCQFYCWADYFDLKPQLLNKFMDSIQDSFLSLDTFPLGGLIHAIYTHTKPGCLLRSFALYSLYYNVRTYTADDKYLTILRDMFVENPETIVEFATIVKYHDGVDRDPRIRDGKEPTNCLECGRTRLNGQTGFPPCQFHIHSEDDGGCYLQFN